MKKTYIRPPVCIYLSILALVLSILCMFSACSDPGTPSEASSSTSNEEKVTSVQTNAQTDLSTQEIIADTSDTQEESQTADTQAETQSEAPAFLLNKETCVIRISSYAAEWEISAAQQLAQALGVDIISDTQSSACPLSLHVGYTTYTKEQYGESLDRLGDWGYLVTTDTQEQVILIYANTKAGMVDAVDALMQALQAGELGHTLSSEHHDRHVQSSETAPTPIAQGEWGTQLDYAKSLENGVYTYFPDAIRKFWVLANQNVTLNYDTKQLHGFTSITNADGIPYVMDTGFAYLINSEGTLFSCTDSYTKERTNTYQLGYYYYNAHIMEAAFLGRVRNNPLSNMRLDRTFHIYSDKLNTVQHLVTSEGEVTDLAAYGQYFDIAADRVLGICIKDASGYHDSLEGVDWDTVEYAGFDIERAGIFGIILVDHENSGKLTVTLQDGYYRIDQRISADPSAVYPQNTHFYFGQRIYTDQTHSFDTFKNEAECERHPLTSLSIFKSESGATYAEYDALRGAYRFNVVGSDFGSAYYNTPNKYYAVNATVEGDALDRKLYVYTNTTAGALECAVVLDKNKNLLPIALEVGKNFCGENEESTFDPGDFPYGQVFMPLCLSAGETKEFTILNLYQNWGKFPLKQLSSIQFTSPYYHLSCGVTETNCIAPTYVYGKDHWLLPDFRSMSAPLWASQPQHTAVGQLHVMEFTDIDDQHSNLENHVDIIDSYGPVYADVTLEYMAADNRVEATYRHVEMPHTDENRTYYTIDIRVNQDISFVDFKNNFSIFRFNSRLWHFAKIGYLDENNQHQILDCTKEQADRYLKLGAEAPYYEYHQCSDPANNNYVNFALIIKNAKVVISGEDYHDGFIVRDFYHDGRNFGDLTLDLGRVTLKAGDYIHLDIILLPWGSQESVDNSNVLNVREDAVLNPYTLNVKTGHIVQDTYVPKVAVDKSSGTAEFTLTGGTNNAVVRVYGLLDYQKPVIEEFINGQWVTYNTTVKEFDGYMVYNDGDGSYSVAFCIDMTEAGEQGRTFRVVDAAVATS